MSRLFRGPISFERERFKSSNFGHRLLFEGNICKFMLNMVWNTWYQLVVMQFEGNQAGE